jgi:hypothetical protein
MSSFAPPSPTTEIPVDGRHHVESMLMRESLLDKRVMSATETPVVPMLPFCRVLKVGGRSIVDRGKSATYPLVDAIAATLANFKLVIATGGGIRSRHVTSIGMDLGLPTGVLAQLRIIDALANAHLLGTLLAPHGVVAIPPEILGHMLPFFIKAVPAVICNGDPPFSIWEHPPRVGRIAPHRRRQFFARRVLWMRQSYADQRRRWALRGRSQDQPKGCLHKGHHGDGAQGAQAPDLAVRQGADRSSCLCPPSETIPDHQRAQAASAGTGAARRTCRNHRP